MLTHYRIPVCLSLISTDLPILSSIETAATIYQKDSQWFHLLVNHSDTPDSVIESDFAPGQKNHSQLLWFEISPHRVIMTLQGKGKFAYRHFWEKGIYGVSRYWLNGNNHQETSSFRLRNYTRNLTLQGLSFPEYLRVDYELWSNHLSMGHYVLHLEIYS